MKNTDLIKSTREGSAVPDLLFLKEDAFSLIHIHESKTFNI